MFWFQSFDLGKEKQQVSGLNVLLNVIEAQGSGVDFDYVAMIK